MERLEDTILRSLLYNEEYARKTIPFFKEEYFTQIEDMAVFQEIQKYFTKDILNQLDNYAKIEYTYGRTNEDSNGDAAGTDQEVL